MKGFWEQKTGFAGKNSAGAVVALEIRGITRSRSGVVILGKFPRPRDQAEIQIIGLELAAGGANTFLSVRDNDDHPPRCFLSSFQTSHEVLRCPRHPRLSSPRRFRLDYQYPVSRNELVPLFGVACILTRHVSYRVNVVQCRE